MLKKVITYFSVRGYDEDGTEDCVVLTWACSDEEEFEYALNVIDSEDIISITEKNFY